MFVEAFSLFVPSHKPYLLTFTSTNTVPSGAASHSLVLLGKNFGLRKCKWST